MHPSQENLYEENRFSMHAGSITPHTYVDQVEASTCGLLALTPTGSHCPFLDGWLLPLRLLPWKHGGITIRNWSDDRTVEWFKHHLQQ